jgi:hypothetical protein
MTHLDEGTIHAWLDGALDGRNASDVEAHVATCATCNALVAEARGFIAGASRILTALDDVPAGVTPKRAPSTAPAIRHWRVAPWVTGIAAVLVLAIGIKAYTRAPAPPAAHVLAQRPVPVADSSASRAARATPVVAPTVPTQAPASASRRDAAIAARRGSGLRERAELGSAAGAAGAGAAQDRAGGLAAVQSSAAPAREPTAPSELQLERKKTLADVAAGAPMSPPIVIRKSAPTLDAVATKPAALDLAGCYPIELPAGGRPVEAAAAVAGKVAARARPDVAQARTAPLDAKSALLGPPAVVLLDTNRHPAGGYVARSAATQDAMGSWNRIDGDSVRVDLLVRGLYTIAASKRASCPP